MTGHNPASTTCNEPAVFNEEVPGVHTACVTRSDSSVVTLTVVESGDAFVTYMAGEPTGKTYRKLPDAKRALLKRASRRSGFFGAFKRAKKRTAGSERRQPSRSPLPSLTTLAILGLFIVAIGSAVVIWAAHPQIATAANASRPPPPGLNTRVTVRDTGKIGRTLTLRELIGE